MPLVLPDGYGLTTIYWNLGGLATDALTVIGTENDGTASNKAGLVKDAFETEVMPQLSDACVLTRVKTIQRDGATYTEGEAGSGQNGGVALSMLPPNCTFLVRKLTTELGRAGKGRMYIPGACESEVTNNGVVSTARIASLQQAMTDALVASAGWVILHRDPLNPSDYNNAPPSPLYGVSVEPRIATQRRRLR